MEPIDEACGARASLRARGDHALTWDEARREVAAAVREALTRERVRECVADDVIDEVLAWAMSRTEETPRPGAVPVRAWIEPMVRRLVRAERTRRIASLSAALHDLAWPDRGDEEDATPRRPMPLMSDHERRIAETVADAGSQAAAAVRLGVSRARVRACIERLRRRAEGGPPPQASDRSWAQAAAVLAESRGAYEAASILRRYAAGESAVTIASATGRRDDAVRQLVRQWKMKLGATGEHHGTTRPIA